MATAKGKPPKLVTKADADTGSRMYVPKGRQNGMSSTLINRLNHDAVDIRDFEATMLAIKSSSIGHRRGNAYNSFGYDSCVKIPFKRGFIVLRFEDLDTPMQDAAKALCCEFKRDKITDNLHCTVCDRVLTMAVIIRTNCLTVDDLLCAVKVVRYRISGKLDLPEVGEIPF